ncbi:hypothetical protein EOA32_02980 [Mesorhizobium sp. M1A.F.Ca.ET.072.01.1.1]|nr:hypothetical protein EOA32_02980 [Mesorhizobium sp. M1A.F.Ca.ET.072.01.1.1]TIU96394.1 MAG: hypothetical protein E5W04_28635 [Mesorhizobium sp.]
MACRSTSKPSRPNLAATDGRRCPAFQPGTAPSCTPHHMGTLMELLINAANILYVIAYFTMDMLRLRMLTLTAATCLAVYFYCQPVPMLNVVAWNVFFIGLNVVHITRIVRERYTGAAT